MVARYGLGAAAMRYQQLGYPVFPLGQLSKRPHRMLGPAGGFKHASSYWPDVDRWWSQDLLAGIGVPTGMASGLVVIDLDVKRGDNGTVSFTGFLNEHRLQLPPMPTVVTPSGGYHMWLRIPPITLPSRTSILPGVDIKADGGYVAVPPTMAEVVFAPRSGDRGGTARLPYRWASGCPCSVPWAPQWLASWVAATPGTGSSGEYETPPDLEDLAEHGLAPGERNTGLYRLACSRYRKHGTSHSGEAIVRSELETVIAATDQAGFSRTEIERTIASAREWVRQQEADDLRTLSSWESWLGGSGG
jgi:hypothetical protein